MSIQQVTKNDIQFLHTKSRGKIKQPPIVLVHGAYNNGHVWEQTFMPYFSEQGHEVFAIHLKNKEEAFDRKTLFSYNLKSYTQKLSRLIDLVGEPAYMIGHSMGGLIVQKYLEQASEQIRAACLLAAVAPFGTKNTLKMMFANPIMLLKYTALTLDPSIAKKYPPSHGLLSARSDETTRKSFQSFIIRESAFALFGTFYPNINTTKVKQTPLLVKGAANDNLVLPKDVVKTGEIYDYQAKVYPEMGHFMMLEPDWQPLADDILSGFNSINS